MQEQEDARRQLVESWLTGIPGVDSKTLRAASEDASFRRYFRVDTDGGTAIVMDAPPPQEDTRPFVTVAGYLESIGVNAPRVLAANETDGILLLSDLGSTPYLSELNDDSVISLYRDAIDALLLMQQGGDDYRESLPLYDEAFLRVEVALFHDWLCESYAGIQFSAHEQALWDRTIDTLLAEVASQPRVFVHRDFHSRNLMVTDDDNPGVLDFQDAMNGPLTYDLVSLLKDCYVRWPDALRDDCIEYFLAMSDIDCEPEQFRRWFDYTGVQRHLKAAGIFCRLWLRDGKPSYLADVPLTVSYITELNGRYPALDPLIDWIETRVMPAFEKARDA
ncbi:MAG: phosphotransferase [Pseudomonadota bacterium]